MNGGLTRARSLQRVADVLVAELQRTREVCMTGARERYREVPFPVDASLVGQGLIPVPSFGGLGSDDEREGVPSVAP